MRPEAAVPTGSATARGLVLLSALVGAGACGLADRTDEVALPPRRELPVAVTGPAVPGGTCPAGMVPVPAAAPRFCIDAYEASRAGTQLRSVVGVEPLVGLSFDAAMALCAATPALDNAGHPHGNKRIALTTEWEDALDGQPGPGGQPYPYGNTWTPGACNVPDTPDATANAHLLPTGARPDCVSPFGVFDLLGNAWEWTDSGVRIDIGSWMANARRQGLPLVRAPDGTLRVEGATRVRPSLVLNTVRSDALRIGDDGTLTLPPEAVRPGMFLAGYLALAAANHVPPAQTRVPMLPVAIVQGGPDGAWRLRLRVEDDGKPFPDKRGCAFYAGNAENCSGGQHFWGHPHDFSGSIAPRCVCDPIPPS